MLQTINAACQLPSALLLRVRVPAKTLATDAPVEHLYRVLVPEAQLWNAVFRELRAVVVVAAALLALTFPHWISLQLNRTAFSPRRISRTKSLLFVATTKPVLR